MRNVLLLLWKKSSFSVSFSSFTHLLCDSIIDSYLCVQYSDLIFNITGNGYT